MTKTGAAARPDLEDRAEDIREWALLHSRALTGAAVVIVLAVGAGLLYVKSQQAQASNASTALLESEQALGAGNVALAQSELEKLIARYGSTDAGKQARLLLAQAYYDGGKYDEGIATLKKLVASDPKMFEASAQNLIGAGYEQQNKYQEAADAYQKAADQALGKADRDAYLANAARALTAGGKTADAIKLWTKLAADPSSTVSAEAKVRLGELQVKAATTG